MFQVGQKVTWTSQSHGSTKTKEGTIVAVVPKGVNVAPLIEQFADHNREAVKTFGTARSEDSYLVSLPSKTGRGRAKLYWPNAKKLQLAVAEIFQESAL